MVIEILLEKEGKEWLENRSLNPELAESMGVGQTGDNIVFNYEHGNQQRIKYRNMEDKKIQFYGGKVFDDWIMPFFNQRDFEDKSYLILTEGELDAVAVAQLGFTNAISIPNGASSAEKTIKENYKYILEYKLIYLFFDNDEAGQLAVQQAKSMLPKYRWRSIITPQKDANEFLKKGGGAAGFKRYLENAERCKHETVVDMKDLVQDAFIEIDPGFSTGWRTLDEKLGGIRTGELTVLTGDTGCGKTSFAVNLMHNLAKQDIPVYMSSYEVSYVKILKKLASHVLKKPMCDTDFDDDTKEEFMKWAKEHKVYLNPTFGSSTLDIILQEIEYASHILKVKVILLDHLHFFLDFSNTESERTAIDRTVREIVKCARNNNVHILLVVHPRQGKDDSGEISMAMLKGSSAIKQDSHNVMGIQRRDRIDPNDPRVILKVMKNREYGIEGPVYFYYNQEYGGYETSIPEPIPPAEPQSYVW